MFADPKQTALRRVRRRLKAGLSIAVAIVAGAWLASRPSEASPQGPDARMGPPRGGSAPPPPDPEDAFGERGQDSGEESGGESEGVACTNTGDAGLAVRDAGAGRRDGGVVVRDGGRRPRVDRYEHRNGMPVRDNLVE